MIPEPLSEARQSGPNRRLLYQRGRERQQTAEGLEAVERRHRLKGDPKTAGDSADTPAKYFSLAPLHRCRVGVGKKKPSSSGGSEIHDGPRNPQ